MKNKSCFQIMSASGALLLVLAGAAPAVAAPPPKTVSAQASEVDLIRAMQELDIAGAVQQDLLEKYESGVTFDSDSGATPIDSETVVENGYEVTTNTYKDGSKSVRSVEMGTEVSGAALEAIVAEAAPFIDPTYDGDSVVVRQANLAARGAITGCRFGTSAGISYWNNCRVSYTGITASNSFNANYQRGFNVASAQYIAGTAKFVSPVQSVSNEQVIVYNGNRIRYTFNVSFNGIGNIPGFLQLTVSSSAATVQWG